eukprot:13817408-Alexandrium_andersonii.AAC.1
MPNGVRPMRVGACSMPLRRVLIPVEWRWICGRSRRIHQHSTTRQHESTTFNSIQHNSTTSN